MFFPDCRVKKLGGFGYLELTFRVPATALQGIRIPACLYKLSC